jgi:hypothetical protein
VVASILGPIVAKEVAKVVVPKIRKQLGFGLAPAGGRGLKLAGQGVMIKPLAPKKKVARRKKKAKKKVKRRGPHPRMALPKGGLPVIVLR